MGSGQNQPTPEIDWDEWSRVVEAAQDPKHRRAVQKYLANADLSAEVPAALDEKVLARRRSEGATDEQCASVLCNLGFDALAAGSKGSAEFAMACGRLVEQLGPATPDLALRRHFLFAKGELLSAVLTNQPHLVWSDAALRCTDYLRALDRHFDALPDESVESNAMAAYSFAGQCLSRIHKMRAVEHYADETSQLVDVALSFSSRLSSSFASRMWSNVMPGIDAGILFRRIGAAAEQALQTGEDSTEHASTGLTYIDQILSRYTDRAAADIERLQMLRAMLLLASGRDTEACEQAELHSSSSDASTRTNAMVIKARCDLKEGNPEPAAASLARLAPTTDHALEEWRSTWVGETGDPYWTDPPDANATPADSQDIWRLQAVAAADANDVPSFLAAADRATGFLTDSLIHDRSPEVVAPMLALHEIFEQLPDGAAVLHVTLTQEGILTAVARQRIDDVSITVVPDRPNVKKLREAQKWWSHAYFDSLRHSKGCPAPDAEDAASFSALMDEIRRIWGDLMQELVDEGIDQLILVGDDLVDIPLHAVSTGSADERLIDRVPVTYVPSIAALRACMSRTPRLESRRRGVVLRSLIDAELDPVGSACDALAAILDTENHNLAADAASFRTDAAAAQVLNIVARATHEARAPFESIIGAGSLDLSVAELLTGLDLPECEFVSNMACESVLPSTLRAPGFDLSAVFLAAGARNVLASTWVVNEDLASRMAESFAECWVSGLAPSAAFQRALRRLRDESLPDVCWAGMRLVGAP